MTEHEWLACTNPQKMLTFLRDTASDRRLGLFACACCRCIWHLLKEERSRQAVEVAERFAEGTASEQELAEAEKVVNDVWKTYAEGHGTDAERDACDAALSAVYYTDGALGAAVCSSDCAALASSYDGQAAAQPECQCRLLRDIFGNPFRPVSISSACLFWHDGLLVSMAQKMYDSRDFSDMPILADALEEAGCTNPDILAHCRGSETHVRGCWIVDLLLGKE
jgi:hypothetical protein